MAKKDTPTPSVFNSEFVARRNKEDYAVTITGPGFSGPFRVERHGDDWAVVREGFEKPFAVLYHREVAYMLAAVLPAIGRELVFHNRFDAKKSENCLEVIAGESGFECVGRVSLMEERTIPYLHLLHTIFSEPTAFASLLIAAPGDTLERAGRLAAKWSADLGAES